MTVIFLAVMGAGDSRAEDTAKQLWLDYNPSWMLSPKVTVEGDLGFRTELDSGSWHRLVLNPGIKLPKKSFILRGGIGNYFTFSHDIQNRWELRPYQGVTWVWPRTAINFDHYLRLEERFDFNTVDWTSEISLRARYRLRLRYKFAESRPDRYWRAFSSGEMFVKLAGTEGLERDQYRVTLGIERSFHRLMRWRLEGIWRQQELSLLPSDEASEFYWRVRFYQNF